jgi:hypothetical protein
VRLLSGPTATEQYIVLRPTVVAADDKRQPCRSMVLTGQIFSTLCLHELALLAVGETYGGRYGEDQVTFLITGKQNHRLAWPTLPLYDAVLHPVLEDSVYQPQHQPLLKNFADTEDTSRTEQN